LPDDRAADDESGADVGAGLVNRFHSITFPTIHRHTFKSICRSADVTDFRRAPGRAGLTMIKRASILEKCQKGTSLNAS
jgi:hypothetical protein